MTQKTEQLEPVNWGQIEFFVVDGKSYHPKDVIVVLKPENGN